MAAPYTPRQGQFLAYIHTYTKQHGRPPSEAEIATFFFIAPPSAHQMVMMLERRGLISRTPGQARSLRVLLPPDALPNLYGGETPRTQESVFETRYPHIANWIVGGGWVELGRTEYSRSMARALDEGGMVWEGSIRYTGMDELLRDLDKGLAQQE